MDDATPEEGKPKGIKPAKLTAVIVAAVVVALAGIGGGYAYWTHHEGNAYHEAVAQAENADKALSKAVDEATATEYKADQLKEPKLLDKLDDAIRKAKALNAALKAVRDSKLAKELNDAKSQLRQGIDGAGQTLRDTDGKVADNTTRDSLAKAIDEANNTLSKKGVTDPKTYTDAKAKLDAAVRQVTDSKAKEQADAEAAAQAQAQAQAAAQAAQAAAQSQRSYSQSYNRYGGSSRGYSSNRGYSAPQQSYTPSNNGGSSSSSNNGGGLHIIGGGVSDGLDCSQAHCNPLG